MVESPSHDGADRSIGQANSDARFGSDLADMVQDQGMQARLQAHRFFWTDHETEFEVLAIVQGMVKRRSLIGLTHQPGVFVDGNMTEVQRGTEPATFFQNVAKVRDEAVGNINHGPDRYRLDQRLRLEDPRFRVKMPPQETASERSGDEDLVSRPSTCARDGSLWRAGAEQGDGDDQRAIPAVRVAADQVHVKPSGQR